MIFQRVDGEVNVKVELQPQGLGVHILDVGRDVFFPQLKEHLVGPIIEAAQQLSLFARIERADKEKMEHPTFIHI